MKNSALLVMVLCMLTMQLSAQDKKSGKEKEAKQLATKPSSISLEKLIQQKSDSYVITKEHVSSISGIRHVYVRQAINGLEVYGTESSVHYNKSGKVLVEHSKFLNNVQATLKSNSQGISAKQAIISVANQMGYKISNLQETKSIGGKNKAAIYSKAGISSEEIPVKLMYYYREGFGTQLVWELSIAETTSSDWWNFRVDASTGKIIDKDNWTISCNILGDHESHEHAEKDTAPFVGPMEKPVSNVTSNISNLAPPPVASYNVYAMPVESPFFGSRSVVSNPENLTASPFGWHDIDGVDGAEFTNTRGNNVDAYDDDDNNNAPDNKYAVSPGGNLVFNFPLNTTYSAGDQSQSAAITNLFYWTNIIHDVMYQYGFDEASGNFQQNNYGNGGAGNDPVNAEAQDGSGNCNANFGTPADGGRPRMQMYVCSDKDGDLDSWVIVHEYGHGISNRLNILGGQEQMGEGWSDFYGLLLTMVDGTPRETPRGFGSYAFSSIFGMDGARTQPYSTDFAINNYTYDSIKTEVAPHGVGSVWAEMLWEMTWELIDLHGFSTDFYNGTGGNNVALALVTEGLKLQPANSGFVDGRDAILLADQVMYGGANKCAIWAAFAKRGLGFSASQGSSSSKTDGTEAFDLPPNFALLDVIDEVCLSGGIQTGLSGGNPAGGVYGGLGVTDNGGTFTFDPSVGGPGLVTVTYQVMNDFCSGGPTTLTDDINVTNDPPEIICMGSGNVPMTGSQSSNPGIAIPDNNPTGVTVTMNVTEDVTITDLDVNLDIFHTYVGDVTVTIKSPANTTAIIIARPGVPSTTDGCSGNNIFAILNDEAATPVESECAGSVPTINGSFTPNNPLSIFDGESTMGIWELTVSDAVAPDPGTLNSWGIDYDYEVTAPVLDVTLDASGNATINAEDLLYSALVDCGGYTVTSGSPLAATVSFNCSDIGLNTIDVEVTNDSGATSTCSAIVNVIGSGAPGPFVCPGDSTQDNDPVICGAVVTYTVASPSGCGSGTLTQTAGLASGSTFPIGTTTNTFEYDDGINPVQTCSFDVTVEDNEAPVVSCPANITQDSDSGVCEAVVTFTPTATDNCAVASIVSVPASGSVFPVGTTTVTVTATDTSGNTDICTFDVTVEDNEAPMVSCPANITQDSDLGVCEAVVSFTLTATDNCADASIVSVPASGSVFPVGTTTVTVTATDTSGNTAVCTFDVTVEDNEAPVVFCPANITQNSDLGVCEAVVTFTPTATDNCAVTSIVSVPASGSVFPVGTTTVTVTATDTAGNTDICTFDVTVQDNELPVALCMDITVQLDATGNKSIVAADVDGGSTDNCAIASLAVSIDTFDCSNVGPNNVTLTVTDVNGNSSSCIAIVTVEDNIAPLMNCPADFAVGTDAEGMCGANVSFAAPTPVDPCGIDTVVQTAGLPSGSVFPVGASVIEYTATDANGNTTTCSFTITVVDNDAPTAVCMDITIQLDAAGNATIVPADVDGGSTDNCAVDTLSINVDTFTCADLGANNVVLTVTDTAGLTSTCTAIVTVEDITPPTVVCQDITVSLDATGTVTIDPSLLDGGSTDSCGAGIFTYSATPDTFTCAELGDNTVTLTVTDENGNSATCDAMVTVEDDTAPTIVCQDITVQLEENGMVTIVATDLIANADDACGVATTAVDIDTFTCDDLGTSVTVTVSATDASGNSTTCTATVTIVDEAAPQFDTGSLPEDQVRVADESGEYILEDFTTDVIVTDNCSILDAAIVLGQDPAIGTVLTVGVYDITLSAEDDFGNLAEYVFELEVTKALSIGENSFDISSLTMYPNPATNYIILSNPQNISLKEVSIYDVTGRLIKKIDASKTTSEVNIDVSELASATYMIIINTNAGQVNKQLVKE